MAKKKSREDNRDVDFLQMITGIRFQYLQTKVEASLHYYKKIILHSNANKNYLAKVKET